MAAVRMKRMRMVAGSIGELERSVRRGREGAVILVSMCG